MLFSRYVAHTDDRKRARELQVKEAKDRFFAYAPRGELVSNPCGCSYLKELSMPGGSCSPVNSPVQLIDGNLSLLCSEMAIRAVHELIEFVPQLQSKSGTEITFVKGTIVNLAHLNAFLATVVTCFSDEGAD